MVAGMTKAKSITFRCSENQYRRLEEHLGRTVSTRTDVICEALEQFLDFADANSHMDLFGLVEAADSVGAKRRFEDEA